MLTAKPKFDWGHVVWSHADGPPPFMCGYCSGELAKKPRVRLRRNADDCVAIMCDKCVKEWWTETENGTLS